MFDIGWQELFVIGVVALVVVGPKDLPGAMRAVVRVVQKARTMSREVQTGFAQMMREAELDELKRKLDSTAHFDPAAFVRDEVDPTGSLSADFDPEEFNRRLKQRVEGVQPETPAPAAAAEGGRRGGESEGSGI